MNFQKLRKSIFPELTLFRWIESYNKETARSDAIAGLTVAVMVIPQSMAYAVLAGVPPIYGLYASVVPLLIYPLFGTARQLSFGVIAIDMIIVAAGVGLIAQPGTANYLMLVLLLSIMVGFIQLLMSVARLGFIVNLLSKPVILGFTAAAPIIITLSQIDNLLGLQILHRPNVYALIEAYFNNFGSINLVAAIIGIGSILLLILLKTFYESAPKALIIIMASGITICVLQPAPFSIELVGSVSGGLPSFNIPSFQFSDLRRLLPTAITLALVQFMTVISLGKTFGFKHGYSVRANNELFALGSANILGGLFQSLPASGSYSRSAINEQAGGKTPLTNVFTALIVVVTLLFLTPLLYYIPMPALAAIIIVAALSLIDIDEVKDMFIAKERDGFIALFTFLTVLFIGIQEGILLGVAASLFDNLIRNSRPNLAVLGRVRGDRIFRDVENFPTAKQVEGILVLRVDASFSFNNAEYFKKFILDKSDEKPINYVVVDGQSINDMDTTAIETLEMMIQDLKHSGIKLHFAGLKGPVREVVIRSGLARKMGGQHFHLTPDKAVRYILENEKEEDDKDDRLEKYEEGTD